MTLDDLKAFLQAESGMEMPSYTYKDSTVIASKECPIRHEIYTVEIPISAYENWRQGAMIQNALPKLSIEQREFLLNGRTPAEQARDAQVWATENLD